MKALTYEPNKTTQQKGMTPKQIKARAKNKRARKARRRMYRIRKK